MPSEYRLILKHADEPGYSPDIACYMRHGGYEALKKALAHLTDGSPKKSGRSARPSSLPNQSMVVALPARSRRQP